MHDHRSPDDETASIVYEAAALVAARPETGSAEATLALQDDAAAFGMPGR